MRCSISQIGVRRRTTGLKGGKARRPCSSGCRRWTICFSKAGETLPAQSQRLRGARTRMHPTLVRPPGFLASASFMKPRVVVQKSEKQGDVPCRRVRHQVKTMKTLKNKRSLLLAFCMCLSLCSFSVEVEQSGAPASGPDGPEGKAGASPDCSSAAGNGSNADEMFSLTELMHRNGAYKKNGGVR